MRRTPQTGTRGGTNIWWIETKSWRGRVYEEANGGEAEYCGDEAYKVGQGGKLGKSIVSETAGTSRNTTESEPGKSSYLICAIDSISSCKKCVRRASSCNDMRTSTIWICLSCKLIPSPLEQSSNLMVGASSSVDRVLAPILRARLT